MKKWPKSLAQAFLEAKMKQNSSFSKMSSKNIPWVSLLISRIEDNHRQLQHKRSQYLTQLLQVTDIEIKSWNFEVICSRSFNYVIVQSIAEQQLQIPLPFFPFLSFVWFCFELYHMIFRKCTMSDIYRFYTLIPYSTRFIEHHVQNNTLNTMEGSKVN